MNISEHLPLVHVKQHAGLLNAVSRICGKYRITKDECVKNIFHSYKYGGKKDKLIRSDKCKHGRMINRSSFLEHFISGAPVCVKKYKKEMQEKKRKRRDRKSVV